MNKLLVVGVVVALLGLVIHTVAGKGVKTGGILDPSTAPTVGHTGILPEATTIIVK